MVYGLWSIPDSCVVATLLPMLFLKLRVVVLRLVPPPQCVYMCVHVTCVYAVSDSDLQTQQQNKKKDKYTYIYIHTCMQDNGHSHSHSHAVGIHRPWGLHGTSSVPATRENIREEQI